jgi:hypothetical protein
MRVRFKKAVREGICHAEEGIEWAVGDLEARTMLAMGWAEDVKDQPQRHSGANRPTLQDLDAFLRAVGDADEPALCARFKAALAEAPSGAAGGYLVPPELAGAGRRTIPRVIEQRPEPKQEAP